jgi:hypothetical protein
MDLSSFPSSSSSSSSSSPSSSSSDSADDEKAMEGFSLTVNALATATQAVVARITTSEEADLMELDTSSDEEYITSTWGGSVPGRKNVNRDFEGAHNNLVKMYFSGPDSMYTSTKVFERRFGMPRVIFNKVFEALKDTDSFKRRYNPVNKEWGVYPLVRFCAAMRMLVYGSPADRMDETFQMGETTISLSFKDFCKEVILKFGDDYLNRCPTAAEKARVLSLMKQRGFPGAFASWDCKHFSWANCPTALHGQYKGKEKSKTMILEAICDPNLYIWYHFFGEPGSLNDLNILGKSSIVGAILTQSFDTSVEAYTINGNSRDWLYFLVDGIYPKWSILCKSVRNPTNAKMADFSARQESVRKDIERCFGVLIQKFGILKNPIRSWFTDDIKEILDTAVILHNMTVEVRRYNYTLNDLRTVEQGDEDDNQLDDDDDNGQQHNRGPAQPFRSTFQRGDTEYHHDDDEEVFRSFFESADEEVASSTLLAGRIAHMTKSIEDEKKHMELFADLQQHIHKNYVNAPRVDLNP